MKTYWYGKGLGKCTPEQARQAKQLQSIAGGRPGDRRVHVARKTVRGSQLAFSDPEEKRTCAD